MRRYLATLHTRSERHKKHFSLAVSAAATLTIFAIWTAVRFGPEETVTVNRSEVGPLSSLRENLGSAFEGFQDSFEGLKGGIEGGFQFINTYGGR